MIPVNIAVTAICK